MMSSTTVEENQEQLNALGHGVPPGRKVWRVGTLAYTAAGLVVVFFWLLWGDFAFWLRERSVLPAMQVLLKNFQASDFVMGFLIGTLPQLISIFAVPVVSYKSDRHRGRMGRRIPFLLVPTPIAFLSMVGLAYSPILGNWLHGVLGAYSPGKNFLIITNFAVFWTIFEFCSLICISVLYGLVNDVVPRELLGRFFALFRIFSLLAGMTFSYYLLGKVEQHYMAIFLGIGTLYLFSFGAMCFRVKEGKYPDPPPVDTQQDPVTRFFTAIKTYFRECFSHPYYRWFFLSYALANIAFQPINLFYLVYAKQLNMGLDLVGKYAALQLFLSLIQAYPIGWLVDKFHAVRMTMIALFLYAATTMLAFFLIDGPYMLGLAIVICGTIAGFWGTATASLAPVLLPRAKYATFASAMGMVNSLGIMLASAVAGQLLDLLHHQYRFIYLWASFFTALSLCATVIVYLKFMKLGGPKAYVAPE